MLEEKLTGYETTQLNMSCYWFGSQEGDNNVLAGTLQLPTSFSSFGIVNFFVAQTSVFILFPSSLTSPPDLYQHIHVLKFRGIVLIHGF